MVLSIVAAVALSAAGGDRPKIAVMSFSAGGGADESVAAALNESVAIELTRRGLHEVVTAQDIQTLLGVERQKQLSGCSDEAQSCMAELADALGARFVLTGSLTRLGETLQLNLQTVDTRSNRAFARATRLANDAAELRSGLPWLVAEATGIPAPPTPSRVLPYSLIGAGAALTVGGAIYGLQAYSQEEQLVTELRLGSEGKAQLQSLEGYQTRAQVYARDKAIGAGAAGIGIALAVTGVLLNRGLDAPPSSVALVPTHRGAALVGVMP